MIKIIVSILLFVISLIFLPACSGSDPEPEILTESVVTDKIAKSSGITRSQSQIGLSALMVLSQEKLSQEEFTKLTNDFPGGKNLVDLSVNLGFTPGSIKTSSDVIQILVNLGVNPVDAGKFLSSVLSVSKNINEEVFGLLSKVYER